MATQRPPPTPTPPSRTRLVYLTTYNLIFASLWASVFVNTVFHASSSPLTLFRATEPQARWIQTASLIEVLHAAFGVIKSPVGTTALQVVTRVIQVWMVWFCFPSSTAPSRAYLALLLAWSIADSIRYFYLAVNLHGRAPRGLVWLRYTMFYPLYPVGIGAEWWLLYRSIEPAGEINSVIPPIFYFFLALYIPGSYTMYTYMMKQRRKTLKPVQKSA